MGFRLWRRVRIAPGLRANLSKCGGSLSSAGGVLCTRQGREASV